MGRFWRNLFTCYREKSVSSESEDERSRMERNICHDITSKNKCTIESVKERITSNGDEIINESPKVTISKTLLKEQNYYESDVFAGTLDNRAVAIRVIKKELNSEAIRECEILLKLEHHENVIKLHFKLNDFDKIYIVTEYYMTSLEDYIQMTEEDKDLSPKEICLQLTQAVDFIHKQKVLYLNLNPVNIHIVGSHGIQKVKLTNFSSAVQWTDKNTDLRDDITLLDGFIAPEHSSINEKHDFATDIYMLGCLFYYIVTNGLKLPNVITKQQQRKIWGILKCNQGRRKSSDVVLCFDITLKMTCFIKYNRTSIKLILEHPFFWTSEKLLNYIIEVAVRIEQRDQIFYSKLEAKRRNVVGKDWTVGLDDIYLEMTKGRNYDGSSVVDLVKVFRNQIAHTNSSRVAEVMGSSNEELVNYFLEKFPHLIPHLYRIMNA